jgi:hypothetical protein
MSTNEFARILLTWIKSFLSWIGIPRDRLKTYPLNLRRWSVAYLIILSCT